MQRMLQSTAASTLATVVDRRPLPGVLAAVVVVVRVARESGWNAPRPGGLTLAEQSKQFGMQKCPNQAGVPKSSPTLLSWT